MSRHLTRLLGALLLLSASTLRADETAGKLKALLEARAESVVSIRAVIKTEISFSGQSQDEESRVSLQGVVVGETGLILVTNTAFSSPFGASAPQLEIKVTPVEFKVTVAEEEKEYDAFLAAKDTKLNLAFLQMRDLGERKLAAVSFDASADAEVGDAIVAISRLDKGYDYAPYFALGRISGRVKKPRRALMYSGNISALGLPVFTEGNELIGVLTQLESGLQSDDEESMNPMRMLTRLQRGGLAGETFVLPAKSVKGVIEQAAKRATELLAEQAGAAEESSEKKE